MPDKKLTDKEIVKALECCSVQKHFVCNECPAWVNSKCIGTHKAVLDLINRLQGEKATWKDYADCLNAENENLKTENLILSQKRFNIFEHCPECHRKYNKEINAEKQRTAYAIKANAPPPTTDIIRAEIREIEQYNKEHGTCLTYGRYKHLKKEGKLDELESGSGERFKNV